MHLENLSNYKVMPGNIPQEPRNPLEHLDNYLVMG